MAAYKELSETDVTVRLLTKFMAALLFAVTSIAYAADWSQINTERYQLIFPPNVASEAQRVAAKLDVYLAAHEAEIPLKRPLKKIPIVLYTDAHAANGNVGLFPYKSRWYNRPAPFAQLEWFDALAVHEGRHIVQFNQIYNNSVGHALAFAFGETGVGLFAGLLTPTWYFEGDAVVSETTLTNGGRGRVASFDLWMRTDALTHQPYSYDRAMLGTGYDRTPYASPYVFGYFMTGDMRLQYGDLIYDDIINNIGSLSSITFDGSHKRATGKNLNELYTDMLARQTETWQQQLDALTLTPIDVLSQPTGNHWQSFYPIQSTETGVTAVEVNVEQGQQLVTWQGGNKTNMSSLPNSVAASFYSGSKTRGVSQQGDQFCWVDTEPHPTKLFQERGDLFCWSKDDGLKQLTTADKLTFVVHTDDGFVAHRFTNERRSQLVFFDDVGKQKSTLELPFHSLAYDFQRTGDKLAFVLSQGEDSGIYQLNLANQMLSLLMPEPAATIRAPVLTNNWLVYTSDRTGIDQLMAMSLRTKETFQIATRPYGAYYPTHDVANSRLVFADYTAQGQQLAALNFTDAEQPEANWIRVEERPERNLLVAELIPDTLPQAAEQAAYEVSQYRPSSHFWRPHSWGLNYTGDSLSGYISSNDVMEKLSIDVQLGYNFTVDDAFGLVNAQYRTDFGPYWLASVINGANQDGGDTDWRLALAQPISLKHGTVNQQWTPTFGVGQTLKTDADNSDRLFGQLAVSISKNKAFQALSAPFAIGQNVFADISPVGDNLRVLTTSQLGFQTFTAHQAMLLSSSAQWLSELDSAVLANSPLFSAVSNEGLTWQGGADYRIQLGAAGKSFTRAAFWRNTELQLNGRMQTTSDTTESAVGVTLKPSFNFLRNANIVADPSLSVYVNPKDQTHSVLFGVTIQDF